MNRRSSLARAVWLCAWVALPALAQDDRFYNYKIFHGPLPWHLDSRGGFSVTGLSINSIENATKNAFNTWENAACSYVDFDYLGQRNNAGNPDPQDDFSVSTNWITTTSDPYYELALGGGESLAAAIPLTYAGAVLRCDIYTNAVNFAWSTNAVTPGSSIDLESAIAREVGHCLGLADTATPTNVMHWNLEPGEERRSLSAEDLDQLCDRYPQDGYGSPCVYDGGRGSCDQPTRSLLCITAPLPGGGNTTPYCSEGCAYNPNINACEPPHVCRSSTLFDGFSGACMPNNNDVVQVGAPCDGGTIGACGPQPKSECFLQGDLPSGSPAWLGGYCTQDCTVGDGTSCPSGASCVDLGGSVGPKCLQTCRACTGDCRSGYSCVALSGYDTGVCVSSCGADSDCPNGAGGVSWCRSCDGLCFEKENPGKQIGEPCLNDGQCGPAQFCYKFPYNSTGVCTQTCTTACSACPNGSFCSDDNPDHLSICMQECREYTCHHEMQCSGIEDTRRACMPQCNSDLDCPDPYSCGSDHHCQHPGVVADAGAAGELFFAGEGGPGSPNPVYDGGTTPGGTGGGCGCNGAPGVTLLWGAAVGLLALAGGRRRWRLR